MQNEKEMRALYLKGFIVGSTCNIMLTDPVGSKSSGEYIKLANKNDIVAAKIIKTDNSFLFEVTFKAETVHIPLSQGKIR